MNSETLLIAEDEPELLEIYGMWFGRFGYRVLTAKNGREALQTCSNNHVDLIITDVRMADMNGIELARELNERTQQSPPVMFLTGHADISSEEAYGLGVCSILHKPIERDRLLEMARNALKPPVERWARPPAGEQREQLMRNYQSLDAAFEDHELNVGRGGIFLRGSNRQFMQESTFDLHLRFEEGDLKQVDGSGILRWQRTASKSELPPGMGVEIVHLNPPALDWATEFISRRRPRAFIPIQ